MKMGNIKAKKQLAEKKTINEIAFCFNGKTMRPNVK